MADLVVVAPDLKTLIIQNFASLYEAFNPLTTLAKTRFVEWFTGDAIDTIWTVTGAGSVSMVDSVDEGLNLAGVVDLHFNDIRHYSNTGSVCIAVNRRDNGTASMRIGLCGDSTDFGIQRIFQREGNAGNKRLLTSGPVTGTNTDTGVPIDTIFTVSKLELTSSDGKLTINGILRATSVTDLPTVKLQPASNVIVSGQDYRIRYLEAYNT